MIDNSKDYTNLFQYIKKNTTLPNAIDEISSHRNQHQTSLDQLKKAIKLGSFDDQIFEHANCSQYLLYLIQSNEIEFWHGMTMYAYLIALAQFTHKQSLRTTDSDTKSLRAVTHFCMTDGKKFSMKGESYFELTQKKFEKTLSVTIIKDEFFQQLQSLPGSEQQVLEIDINSIKKTAIGKLLSVATNNLPFLGDSQDTIMLPSFSMIQYFLKKVSDKPVAMLPIFGMINKTTLMSLHANHQHPVAIYSIHVKSNYQIIHSNRCGPFTALVHDILHIFIASILKSEDIDSIYQHYILMLTQVKQECLSSGASSITSRLIDYLNDLNLTPLWRYSNPDDRFPKFFQENLELYRFCEMRTQQDDSVSRLIEFLPIGEAEQDEIYYLICYHHFLAIYENSPQAPYWMHALNSISTGKYYRDDLKTDLMKTLARNAAERKVGRHSNGLMVYNTIKERLDAYTIWVELLESNKDSAVIWRELSNDHHNALSIMARQHKLVFFGENTPLDEEERKRLLVVAKNELSQLQLNARDMLLVPRGDFFSNPLQAFIGNRNIFFYPNSFSPQFFYHDIKEENQEIQQKNP